MIDKKEIHKDQNFHHSYHENDDILKQLLQRLKYLQYIS